MILTVHPQAIDDTDHACDDCDRQRSNLGMQFLDAVENCYDQIQSDPRLFPLHPRARPNREIRYAALHRFPYLVNYLVRPADVFVISVTHERRRPSRWLKRIP